MGLNKNILIGITALSALGAGCQSQMLPRPGMVPGANDAYMQPLNDALPTEEPRALVEIAPDGGSLVVPVLGERMDGRVISGTITLINTLPASPRVDPISLSGMAVMEACEGDLSIAIGRPWETEHELILNQDGTFTIGSDLTDIPRLNDLVWQACRVHSALIASGYEAPFDLYNDGAVIEYLNQQARAGAHQPVASLTDGTFTDFDKLLASYGITTLPLAAPIEWAN